MKRQMCNIAMGLQDYDLLCKHCLRCIRARRHTYHFWCSRHLQCKPSHLCIHLLECSYHSPYNCPREYTRHHLYTIDRRYTHIHECMDRFLYTACHWYTCQNLYTYHWYIHQMYSIYQVYNLSSWYIHLHWYNL